MTGQIGKLKLEDIDPKEDIRMKGAELRAYLVEAKVGEHEWYKKHEVYQLNGQDLLPDSSVRVVKRQDIKDRISELKELTGVV